MAKLAVGDPSVARPGFYFFCCLLFFLESVLSLTVLWLSMYHSNTKTKLLLGKMKKTSKEYMCGGATCYTSFFQAKF